MIFLTIYLELVSGQVKVTQKLYDLLFCKFIIWDFMGGT